MNLQPNQIMIDLETMGTNANAAILSIGAVRFGTDSIIDEYYQTIDLESCIEWGLEMDASTVKWWLKQSKKAQRALAANTKTLDEVLNSLSAWLGKKATVWGNGSDFDNVILANAYKTIEQKQPWPYYNNRCYRTLKELHPHIKIERQGTHHNALDDATTQAQHLMQILKGMN